MYGFWLIKSSAVRFRITRPEKVGGFYGKTLDRPASRRNSVTGGVSANVVRGIPGNTARRANRAKAREKISSGRDSDEKAIAAHRPGTPFSIKSKQSDQMSEETYVVHGLEPLDGDETTRGSEVLR